MPHPAARSSSRAVGRNLFSERCRQWLLPAQAASASPAGGAPVAQRRPDWHPAPRPTPNRAWSKGRLTRSERLRSRTRDARCGRAAGVRRSAIDSHVAPASAERQRSHRATTSTHGGTARYASDARTGRGRCPGTDGDCTRRSHKLLTRACGRRIAMDVLELIDELRGLVHGAKQLPLTGQVRVDKKKLYDRLDQMRSTIPEEIRQARWIVKEREEM